MNQEYSIGKYHRANGDRSYAVLSKTGTICFESSEPTPVIAYFMDVVGHPDTAQAIDRYIERN